MAVMRNNKHKARLAPHATLFRLRESERMLADDLLENVSVGQWMEEKVGERTFQRTYEDV